MSGGAETTLSSISIRRTHSLPRARAVEAVNAVAGRLQDEYGVQSRWEGATLRFERAGLSGTLALSAAELTIDVELGFLLGALRGSIASGIERQLDEHLVAKPGSARRHRK
jgi:putative polyhydroxyalkanoate system protein